MSNSESSPGQDQLTQLEMKIAYLEQGQTDMAQTVYQQQQEIDLLKKQVARLIQKMRQAQELLPELGEFLDDQRPPHY
jgi:uncharacterized coiled-coil protein SlyX